MRQYKWGWLVSGFYNDTVKPPKKPGERALEVWCGSEAVKDAEVSVFEKREDIGEIIVEEVGR